MIQRISSGSVFEDQIGYLRAVICGPWVLVSGTIGFDCASHTLPDDLPDQTRNALGNIRQALTQEGCTLDQGVGGS